MKKELHPEVKKQEVTCVSCSNKIELKSTKDDIKVDVCSNCHPFYTGKLNSTSKAGRVEKFNNKFNK